MSVFARKLALWRILSGYPDGARLKTLADRLGVSKLTVQRAIKSGRLSATRCDDGSYDIDPAELRLITRVLCQFFLLTCFSLH